MLDNIIDLCENKFTDLLPGTNEMLYTSSHSKYRKTHIHVLR